MKKNVGKCCVLNGKRKRMKTVSASRKLDDNLSRCNLFRGNLMTIQNNKT